MELLRERLRILKLGLGLDAEPKIEEVFKAKRKNSSTPDLSEPGQKTQGIAKNLNRKRTFTEGNVNLNPDSEFQDESMVRSEFNFDVANPKQKEEKKSKSNKRAKAKMYNQSIASHQDFTDDNSRQKKMDGIYESTEEALGNRTYIEKS